MDVLTVVGFLVTGVVVLVWLWQLDVKVDRLRREVDSLRKSHDGHITHHVESLDRRERS